MKKTVSILGSTGSIGKNTLEVVHHLSEEMCVRALAAFSNIDLLEEQIKAFSPQVVAVFDKQKAYELERKGLNVTVLAGAEGIAHVATLADICVVALPGMVALAPTLAAIRCGKRIALANKETLVAAGALVMEEARLHGAEILPVDSEHSALFQCLAGVKKSEIKRLIVTASGGPFRTYPLERLHDVTLEEALAHPTWQMGKKITVDSSTLMNKGLEVIEAHFLFGIPQENIEVVIHPQSIVHGLVESIDGTMIAALSEPHMTYPIQYALTYPARRVGMRPSFSFDTKRTLEFYPPDMQRFPALGIAYAALEKGGSALCFMNGANEELVDRFLRREISWKGIAEKLGTLFDRHDVFSPRNLEEIIDIDREARERAHTI